jgi:hypothetical protein
MMPFANFPNPGLNSRACHADKPSTPKRSHRVKHIAPLTVGIAALLAGCSPIIPSRTIELTEAATFTAADALMVVAVAGAVYYVVDPLAPNWEIRETKLSATRYRIEMRKKRITTGGDGESIELFHRHAETITAQAKAPGYTILSWTEGVESEFPIARRWTRGVIELESATVSEE